jgi:TetR/AcrR family transcriptional regulator, fatty acid metabolism regulator protein
VRSPPLDRPRSARTSRKVDPTEEPEKRRAILHAAVRVFAEKGYHGCRIADVARAAHVAYGLVYHYFRNKEELLASVFAEQWAILLNALRAIDQGPGAASDKLAGICAFALDVYKTAPAAVRVLMLEVTRSPTAIHAGTTRETFQAAVQIIAEVVRQGQAAGELEPSLDPVVAATAILGALEMTLSGLVVGVLGGAAPSEEEIERVKQTVIALVLAGVVRRP